MHKTITLSLTEAPTIAALIAAFELQGLAYSLNAVEPHAFPEVTS